MQNDEKLCPHNQCGVAHSRPLFLSSADVPEAPPRRHNAMPPLPPLRRHGYKNGARISRGRRPPPLPSPPLPRWPRATWNGAPSGGASTVAGSVCECVPARAELVRRDVPVASACPRVLLQWLS